MKAYGAFYDWLIHTNIIYDPRTSSFNESIFCWIWNLNKLHSALQGCVTRVVHPAGLSLTKQVWSMRWRHMGIHVIETYVYEYNMVSPIWKVIMISQYFSDTGHNSNTFFWRRMTWLWYHLGAPLPEKHNQRDGGIYTYEYNVVPQKTKTYNQ